MDPKYKRAVFCKYPSDCKDEPGKKCDCADDDRVEAALKRAHKIRQFEIDLYWRRSLYFWGFQAVFFTAYALAVKNMAEPPSRVANDELLWLAYSPAIAIAALGVLVSFLWFFLEKGSKAWQENWEHHIDQLEDEFTGRLHKVVLGKEEKFYSVTKINKVFIIVIGFAWAFFLLLPFSIFWKDWAILIAGMFIGATLTVILLTCFLNHCGKTDCVTDCILKIKSSFPNEKDHRVNELVAGNSENGIGAGKKINIYYRWQKEKGKKIILP